MKRILVAYSTMAGSTAEVAQAVAADYGRLKWWAVLFAILIIQAPAGDRRNWAAIQSWAAELPAALQLDPRPGRHEGQSEPPGSLLASAGRAAEEEARQLTA